MDKNNIDFSEIESEIFSLVNLVIELNDKFQRGSIKKSYFQKALRNNVEKLIQFTIILKENGIKVSQFIHKMNIVHRYNKAMRILNEHASLNKPKISYGIKDSDGFDSKGIQSSLLELPGLTSEITSSFITLMDALKLGAIESIEIIDKLFLDLIKPLKKFPGSNNILTNIQKIYKHAAQNPQHLLQNKKYQEKIVDHLYSVYTKFQNRLNLTADEEKQKN